jgi:hypothetical protein
MYRYMMCGLVALVSSRALAAPLPPRPKMSALLIPGGVTDPEGKVGFIANVKGFVDAIDLQSGKVLWSSGVAGKPIAAWGSQVAIETGVVDRPNQVRIVVIDARAAGKRVLESEPIVMPDWVVAGDRMLSSSARLHGGDLLVRWKAAARGKGQANGVARINLGTGKTEILDPDKAPSDIVEVPAHLAKITSAAYVFRTAMRQKPLIVGSTMSALVVTGRDDDQQLSLDRWDLTTGKPLESVEMLRGSFPSPVVEREGRTIAVRLRNEPLWILFDGQTGKRLGKIPRDDACTEPTVIGSRAYCLRAMPDAEGRVRHHRYLKAVDLTTGEIMWEVTLQPEGHGVR